MPIQGNARKLIDEKEAFDLWVKLGAIQKVQTHMKMAGKINPNNGKPFTIMAIWHAAMRWVLYNSEEAKAIYQEQGSTLSDLQWEEWLVKKAMYVLGTSSRTRFLRWIERMGFEKYDYLYAEQFGLEQVYSRPVPE
jgi:hypothetical protein